MFQHGITVSRVSNKIPTVSTSSYAWRIQALFYVFYTAWMLKGLLAELTIGNMGAGIPTYVRNCNSDAMYQADPANAATIEKRLNGLLESNRVELEQNEWSGVGYIHGGINAPGGFAEVLSSANLRNSIS